MTILIVDDNAQMRKMVRNFISDFAEEIFECSDGIEALQTYTRYLPDWVLMDIRMKEVNGIVATRQIKAVFPEARIIILTEHNDADLLEEVTLAGADYFVLKDNLLILRKILQDFYHSK